MKDRATSHQLPRYVRVRLLRMRRAEVRPAALAATWFFALLMGYYVLRPVRETMGVEGGTDKLRWLFAGTLLAMLVAVPVYSWLVAKIPRRIVVPLVFQFFALNVLGFAIAYHIVGGAPTWLAASYFIWVAVFSLFSVSVFWSYQADIFSSRQAKRLFGLLAAGGTIGAIAGSVFTAEIVQMIGIANLLLVPAALLQFTLLMVIRLERSVGYSRAARGKREMFLPPTGGSPFAGFTRVVQSPYLMLIALYTVMVSFCGTTVYFQQAEIVRANIEQPAARTELFAWINLFVQGLTLIGQAAAFGLLVRRLGLAVTLCIPAVVYFCGFALLGCAGAGWFSLLGTLVLFEVLRRTCIYAVAVPAKETLFTVVDRQDKYKSKSFIDTVVFRGSDTLTGMWFSTMQRWLGFSIPMIGVAVMPLTLAWGLVGLALASGQRQIKSSQPPGRDNSQLAPKE